MLWDKYTATVKMAFENATYHNTDSRPTDDREDNYLLAGLSVDWRITDHLTANALYQFRKNLSSADRYSFENNQIGVGLTYKF